MQMPLWPSLGRFCPAPASRAVHRIRARAARWIRPRRIGRIAGLVLVALWLALPGPAPAAAEPDAATQAGPITLLAFGDSLTAGYGLPVEDSFPARLETALREKGIEARFLNAGVSGDTTAGGVARLDWSLAQKPDAVILELGANDGLRGFEPETTHDNLGAILEKLAGRDIAVLLTGMRAPPNYGEEYAIAFNGVYERLSRAFDVLYYPFFLEGVAGDPALNQDDGIHPNRAGVDVIVSNILPHVRRLIAHVRAADATAPKPAAAADAGN